LTRSVIVAEVTQVNSIWPSENVAVMSGKLAFTIQVGARNLRYWLNAACLLALWLQRVKRCATTRAFINVPTECLLDELWHTHVCLCSTYGNDARSRCLIGA
jgi:hypothetical protein